MARGGGGIKIETEVTGVRSFVTALRMLDSAAQRRCGAAVRTTTQAVRDGARSKVPISGPEDRKARHRAGPGELRDTIRDEYTGDGLVGFVKAGYGKLKRRSKRTAKPRRLGPERYKTFMRRLETEAAAMDAQRASGVYAMVVEFGAKDRPAAPYMRPATRAERGAHTDRLRAALRGGVSDAASAARGVSD